MKKIKIAILGIIAVLISAPVFGYKDDPGKSGGSTQVDKSASAGCLPPSASAELNVNNVRALIHSGGDMWWDLISNARYEVPKGSGRHSLFVGTLWMGGREAATTTLKLAAQRYRRTGVDFWTGPLDKLGTAEIDATTCDAYDRIYTINRLEVELFRLCECIDPDDAACKDYQRPESIKRWPGNPIIENDGTHLIVDSKLAPFKDVDGDGVYNPDNCDYPFYDLDNDVDCKQDRSAFIYGDFTLYWIFNDKGNIHGESSGNQIGMEIRAQGFGFNTNDEINNMTFYNYELSNRGTTILEQCYFGVNTDADIGGANDDYTGCDVARGFGFMYNGDAFDENFAGQLGYGDNPPAIGIDFFEGPYLDSNGIAEQWDKSWGYTTPLPNSAASAIANITDTTRFSPAFGINGLGFDDTIVDNERYGMRRFVYYVNGNGQNGDPVNATEYYNYLRGFWRFGDRMRFGGTGFPGSAGATATAADFMFPDDSDPNNWGTRGISAGFQWREQNTGSAPNLPGDRRFVQSAGPFTLKPGSVNDITIGVVWARTTTGDPFESVIKVRKADDKAQSLFENCFRVLNGPDAPDLTIQELDRELILYITNKSTSNNNLEEYEELNYFIPEFEQNLVNYTSTVQIETPAIFNKVDLGNGDSLFIYGDIVNGVTADSLIILYDNGGNEMDTLFGYFTNQSTYINSTVVDSSKIVETPYDRIIRFQGYMIYQVSDPTVTATDIFAVDGNSKARLVAQCDVKDFDANGAPIGKLTNFQFDEDLGYSIPKVMVDGQNKGIIHSFKITDDQFALGDKRLVNHKTYYFIALAYGYNNFKNYDPNDPLFLDGQKEPFFLGRRNISVTSAVPHITSPELGGTVLNSLYGTGPRITRIEGRGNGGNYLTLTQESEDAIVQAPYRIDNPVYEYGRGPVNIKVIDPLKIRGGKFVLKFTNGNPDNNGKISNDAGWVLLEEGSPFGDTVAVSAKSINQAYEQIVFDRRTLPSEIDPFMGFSITIAQVPNFGATYVLTGCSLFETRADNNGLIVDPATGLGARITYEDPGKQWLGFFGDVNGPSPLNWIRAGSTRSTEGCDLPFNSQGFPVPTPPSCVNIDYFLFMDPNQVFETNISFFGGGGMVPYLLTSAISTFKQPCTPGNPISGPDVSGHGLRWSGTPTSDRMRDLVGSIRLVLTSDKSKWTRAPVFETQDNTALTYIDALSPLSGTGAGVKKFSLRHSPSVDKNGVPANVNAPNNEDEASANFINKWGMSWFPGYAIDVETGERLNIAFGEDSYLNTLGGRDMIFKPAEADPSQTAEGFISDFGDYLLAGKHFIYVFGATPATLPYASFPNYDHGKSIMRLALRRLPNSTLPDTISGLPDLDIVQSRLRDIWRNCTWTGIPFHIKGTEWLNNNAAIDIRLSRSYQRGYSAVNEADAPQNNNWPMYEFSFDDLLTRTNDTLTAKSALDLIQVVPNPYYAYSAYEKNQLDNRVKIVNLPDVCSVSIYALNGTLIRRFEKSTSEITSLDWDLRNYKNIPIASGLYIIHVKVPGVGEKILKWYGVMRPVDLDSF